MEVKQLFNLREEDTLNPFQTHFLDAYTRNPDANFIVSYPTSSGKSNSIFFLGNKHLAMNKSVVYMAPVKALLEEKKSDFKNLGGKWANVGVVTGDYAKEDKTDEILEDKDIICISQESLVSHLRKKIKSKNLKWMTNIGLLVVDEGHYVGDSSRGANLEVALFELLTLLPNIQVLFLSGTLINSEDFVKWMQVMVPSKSVELVKGTYRPYKLKHIFLKYRQNSKNEKIEDIKNRIIINTINNHDSESKWILPVFKKSYGKTLVTKIRENDMSGAFHYGDLSFARRTEIEKFYKLGHIKVLLGTQTIFVGLNLDAEFGIVTDSEAGGRDIPAHQIQQAVGRIGRYKQGTVYYLIKDDNNFDYHKNRFLNGEPIISILTNYSQLVTHVLGAIYSGWIKDKASLFSWYNKSLAKIQSSETPDLEEIVSNLNKMGFVAILEGNYVITHKGKICSQYMMSPLDVYDWVRNLRKYYSMKNPSLTNLASAYGEVHRFYSKFITESELKVIPNEVKKLAHSSYWKGVTPIYCKLKKLQCPDMFYSQMYSFYSDYYRIKECLTRINNEIERWVDKSTFEKDYGLLLAGEYRVESDVNLNNRNKRQLQQLGIYTYEDALKNKDLLESYGINL